MVYTAIYKNGKMQNFFLKTESDAEFEFMRPYFLLTSWDHPRFGDIMEMECLFSHEVWYGIQKHGCGYASCEDVYETLVKAIVKAHGKKLSFAAHREIQLLRTHENVMEIPSALLEELKTLNDEMQYGNEVI